MPQQERQVPIRDGTPRVRTDGLPGPLRWAIWLLVAESAGLLAVVGFLIWADVNRPSQSGLSAAGLIGATLLLAVLLAGLAWALTRRRAWARGPAIVLEGLLLPIGWTMATNGLPELGVPLIVIGLVGAGSLLAPSTRAALGMR